MVRLKQGAALRAAIDDSFGGLPMVIPISVGLSSADPIDEAAVDADEEMVFEALSRFNEPMEEKAAKELITEVAHRCTTSIGQHAIYKGELDKLYEHVA